MLARKVLLDALLALREHASNVVVVGAQAVYLHAADADLVVVPFTVDADLAVNPQGLARDPRIEACLLDAGLTQPAGGQPGAWVGEGGIEVDLMVPESLGGAGTRGARVPPHDKRAMRKAHGLEAALVDNAWHSIGGLGEGDTRIVRARVAGPAAMLVAKLIKIGERAAGGGQRLEGKDALDLYRLFMAQPEDMIAAGLDRLLLEPLSSPSTEEAIEYLRLHFGDVTGVGSALLRSGVAGTELEQTAPVQVSFLTRRLLDRIQRHR